MSFVAHDLGDAFEGKPLKRPRAGSWEQNEPQAIAESKEVSPAAKLTYYLYYIG